MKKYGVNYREKCMTFRGFMGPKYVRTQSVYFT